MKEFDTFIQRNQTIAPEDNVFMMYVQFDNTWQFQGLFSENAKNIILSEDTVKDMNAKYKELEIMSSFTGKPIEKIHKTYMFIPCPHAEVSILTPSYKED
jgi:hypothetical protein